MSYLLTDQGGEDYALAPVGTHLACCSAVIYAGMQKSIYGIKPKLILSFELSEEKNNAGEPFVVNTFYTASLHAKAKLRAALENWRAKPFTKEELAGFEVTKLLGVSCLVTIAHKVNVNTNKTNAVIAAITSVPRGTTKPTLKAKPLYYSVDDPSESAPRTSVPEWILKICDAAVANEEVPAPEISPPIPSGIPEDEIPF